MVRLQRISRYTLAALLAVGSLAVLPACDWLKASETLQRSSPYVSGLSISPTTVLCGQPFRATFQYDDPQDDLAALLVMLQHGGGQSRQERVLWDPATPNLDLTVNGRASYSYSFTCGSTSGSWTLTVQLEDLRGHISNAVSGTVTLN